MTRPLRLEYEGALYHVTSRGDGREAIFLGDGDRESFLHVLGRVVERHSWLCHAYCLMGNHYHLLLETPDGNLSRGMRQLNGVYTQWFNKKHGRVGHVFQGRFKSIVVDKEEYLLELCRYVVLNPVRAKMVERAEDWAWSSYRATAGQSREQSFLSVDWVLGRFGRRRKEAERCYRAFVREGRGASSPWEELTGQVFLGDESFMKRMGKMLEEKEELKEIPRMQRLAARPSLAALLDVQGRSKVARNKGVYRAFVRYGYTQKEIANHLGVHTATVSRIIRDQER